MSQDTQRTVDWSGLRSQEVLSRQDGAGLRERKKRLTRQLLSDTATEMFLAHGFDAVRVSEIAAACGVSEKTAFNYFPTKESLLLDRWETTSSALREALADPGTDPVEAALRVLSGELAAVTSWLRAQPDFGRAGALFRRFGALLRSTPSLRAHQHAVAERLTAEAAQALAARTGAAPDDPEPLIAATALLGLWQVQARSLGTHLETARDPGQLCAAVSEDVSRAARVLENGLATWR